MHPLIIESNNFIKMYIFCPDFFVTYGHDKRFSIPANIWSHETRYNYHVILLNMTVVSNLCIHKTKMKIYTHYPNGCLGQNKII
jgi:hypothetical protein